VKVHVAILVFGLVLGLAYGQYPWQEKPSLPLVLSGVYVDDGGCLATVPSESAPYIWAAKGHLTTDAYIYDVLAGTWMTRAPVPLGAEGKPVGGGARAASDGGRYVFMVKGNNTLGFYRYDIVDDEWRQLMDVPLGVSNRKVRPGSDMVMVHVDGRDWLYLLKGYYNEFYRYDIAGDTWQLLVPAPVGASIRYYDGSWLVYDGDTTIYCQKSVYHELYPYYVTTQVWGTPLLPMPMVSRTGKSVRSGDGGCAAWLDSSIYALKGNYTVEFWRYFPAANSWIEMETIPSLGSSGKVKRVAGGADITETWGLLYAFKGNSCNEFWCYDARLSAVGERPGRVSIAPLRIANPVRAADLDKAVPPGFTTELYDALGRRVEPGRVRAGTYVLRVTGPGQENIQSLVIVE